MKNRKIKESMDLLTVPNIENYQNFTRGLVPKKIVPISVIQIRKETPAIRSKQRKPITKKEKGTTPPPEHDPHKPMENKYLNVQTLKERDTLPPSKRLSV